MSLNIWDSLSKSSFNPHIREDEIDPRAADNILIAWPPIIKIIQDTFPPDRKIRILDYGCGAGGLCKKLSTLGYSLTGVDSSQGMIDIAVHNSSPNISYIYGDSTILPTLSTFHVIVTIMTMPFIDDVSNVIKKFNTLLITGGVLIIADFNKAWVKESLRLHVWFENFDSIDNPKNGQKTFGELKTPVHIREPEEYEQIANRLGLRKMVEVQPTFPEDFIRKYPDYIPNSVPEYQIMGFLKMK